MHDYVSKLEEYVLYWQKLGRRHDEVSKVQKCSYINTHIPENLYMEVLIKPGNI